MTINFTKKEIQEFKLKILQLYQIIGLFLIFKVYFRITMNLPGDIKSF